MRKITTLLFAICIGIAAFAVPETITVGEDASTASYALPFDSEVATDKSSVSQQLYTQSDLGVSAKSISKITFYIKNKSTSSDLVSISRNVQVWMNEIDLVGDSFPINKTGENVALFGFVYSNCTYKPGTKVYEGSITTPALSAGGENTYDVTFSTPFVWSGTKSALILTVYDVTKTNVGAANLRHIIKSVNEPRFILARDFVDVDAIDSYVSSLYGKYGTWYGNTHTVSGQCTSHKWVNKITFTYTDAPAAPSSPSVSNISGSSATISWTAASDAEAYEIRYSTSVCGLNEASPINVNNVTSYTLGGLETAHGRLNLILLQQLIYTKVLLLKSITQLRSCRHTQVIIISLMILPFPTTGRLTEI